MEGLGLDSLCVGLGSETSVRPPLGPETLSRQDEPETLLLDPATLRGLLRGQTGGRPERWLRVRGAGPVCMASGRRTPPGLTRLGPPFLLGGSEGAGSYRKEGWPGISLPAERDHQRQLSLSPPQQPFGAPGTLAGWQPS